MALGILVEVGHQHCLLQRSRLPHETLEEAGRLGDVKAQNSLQNTQG